LHWGVVPESANSSTKARSIFLLKTGQRKKGVGNKGGNLLQERREGFKTRSGDGGPGVRLSMKVAEGRGPRFQKGPLWKRGGSIEAWK